MWFTFVTARLFIFLSIQPRLAATLLRSCSAVNSPTRRVGLAPTCNPASLAQPSQVSAVEALNLLLVVPRWLGGIRLRASSAKSAMFIGDKPQHITTKLRQERHASGSMRD